MIRLSPALALFAASALASVPAAAQPTPPAPAASRAAVPAIPFRSRTLPNGLTVLSAVDRSTPNVTVQVWYDVGGKDDPQGRSGFAHLFEHLMFKGARDMPPEFIDRLTEDVGGTNNAFTEADTTAFYEVIPANHLERLIWAEAERMGALTFDQANFASEREVVKSELRERVLADPYGRLEALLIPQASFAVHPYKRPVIGSIADLDAATLADVRAFHATYYRPDNAVLIVVGNFEPARLDAWVDRYFGPVPRPGAPIPRVTAVEPRRSASVSLTGYGPTVPLPAVALTFLIPPASHPDAAALTVIDAILSTGKSSRLYRDLVYQGQIAASINSAPDLRQQPGVFQLYAVMAKGHGLDEGEAALRRELARLRDAPVDPAELARAKNQLLAQTLAARETIDGRANELGRAAVIEGDPRRADSDIAAAQAVTAADVQRVARAWLADERRATVRYLPESARPPGAAAPASPPSPAVAVAPPPTVAQAPAAPTVSATPPAPGPAVPGPRLSPAVRVLANGLTVIVAKTSDLPLVTAALVAKSGAEGDPAGQAGLAAFTAELLPPGTAGGTTTRSASQIADAVEAVGGSLEASGGFDQSTLTLTVLADQLPSALPTLAEVARRPAFDPVEIERLRKRKLDALTVSLQDPEGLAGLATWPAVFAGSPYGHAPGGTPASLARIDRAAVTGAYARAFRADNAVLVLTGDVEPEAGFALAQRTFGDWVRPAAPLAPPPAVAARRGPQVIAIDLPGAEQAAVVLAGPSLRRAAPAYVSAKVAEMVLGGGYSARLNEEVRVKRGLSYGAGSSLTGHRAAGLFTASAQAKGEAAGEVAALMLEEAKRLASAPLAPGELDARKASLVGTFGRETERSAGLAELLAATVSAGAPLSQATGYVDAAQAVDAAGMRAGARAAFDPANLTVVIVGDLKATLPGVRTRFPEVRVIAADALDLDSPTLTRTLAKAGR